MRALVLSALVLGLSACAPKKNVPLSEIPSLTKLDDVMAAQATIADPQFKKIGARAYGDADWAAFADAAARLTATSQKIKEFSKGPEFDALAQRLGEKAGALGTAATARDASGASSALGEVKAVCKECHKKFR
jgi:hypothetical protein